MLYKVVAFTATLPVVPIGRTGLSVPSLGSFLRNDQTNTTPTKYVSNQNRGNGSGSSPANAQELQSALVGALPGQHFQAVAQTAGAIEFWSYENGLTFSNGAAGNHIVVEARQGDGIVISRGEAFAGARSPGYWTQSGLSADDIAKKIWRSVGTVNGGAQPMMGWWIEFDHPHQVVSAGSMTNLRAPYGTANSPTNYSGPMVHKDSDGRVYIRFQRPHPGKYSLDNKWSNHIWPGHPEAVSNGQIVYPISENPNSYQIHLFRVGTPVRCFRPSPAGGFITIGGGINTLGFYDMGQGHDMHFKRGVDLVWRNWISRSPTLKHHWFAERRRMSDGSKIHLSRDEWKFGGWLEANFRSALVYSEDVTEGGNHLYFKDCTICDFHEIMLDGTAHYRWRNCTFWHILDDGVQAGMQLSRVEFGYCWFLASAFGGYGVPVQSSDPNPGGWFMHHCVIDNREERNTDWRAQPHPHFTYMAHSPVRSKPQRNYNNTLLAGPDLEHQVGFGLGHGQRGTGASSNSSSIPHEVFNNIIIRQVWSGKRYDPLAGTAYSDNFTARSDYVMGKGMCPFADQSNEYWDYNLYYRDLNGTMAVDNFVTGVVNNELSTFNYASHAAWLASPQFTNSKLSGTRRRAYTPGFEGNGSDVKPTMPSLDSFPVSRFNYRPAAASQVTVAKTGTSLAGLNWWTSPPTWGADCFPWNDGAMTLAPSAWKGALNPNGSTLPVGVQNP